MELADMSDRGNLPAWDGPRTAVVTGAGSGLGTAIAHRLAAEGAQVGAADVNAESAASVAADIVEAGGSSIAVEMDVGNQSSIEAGMNEVRAAFGPITILVNNAGITPSAKFLEIDGEAFDRVMAVNLRGPFQCCQAVVPDMIEAGWGRIVNISSSSAQTGNARMAHYSASKGGLISLTRSLALDLGRKGITVNTIPPGFVETPSLHAAAEAGELGAGIHPHIPTTPMRRVGRPEDIAAAVAFLVRDEADYITGQVLGVNGGRTIV